VRLHLAVFLSIALFIAIIGGWEALIYVFDISPLLVPSPHSIFFSLVEGLATNAYTFHVWITFYETISGFVLGAVPGLALGALIAQSQLAERTLYPYIVAFQTIPKVAVAPIFVIWFGYGVASKIVITATVAFFPVLANTVVGLRAVPSDQVELLISMTASKWQIFRRIRLPNALPYIFVGLDVSIILSVIGAIVGEFVGAKSGLGYLILQRTFNMDMAGMFAILVLLSLMGIGLHWGVQLARRRVIFWAADDDDHLHLT
jgi:NitT/TauT family transport system permease protein